MALSAATATHFLAIAAGVLTVAVGLFVLVARPQAWVNRLFFLLALLDGATTILFRLSYVVPDAALAAYFRATYWYFFIAFIGVLGIFGILFPMPRGRHATTAALVGLVVTLVLAALAAYVADHELFFAVQISGAAVSFPNRPLGNLVNAAFVGAMAILVLMLTLDAVRGGSRSHRTQAAYVLGGMTLAYAPYASTSLAQGLATDPARTMLTGPAHAVVAYWAFAAFCAMLAGSAALLLRDRSAEHARDRRFVLACYVGVGILTLPALVFTSRDVLAGLRAVAFVCYPALLAFAILRYEVFDIDRKVRRAATVTIALGALAIVFFLAEALVENVLQDTLASGIGSTWVAGFAAAAAAAVMGVPVTRVARRLAGRIIPEVTGDALRDRKLEVYRHSLAGALADGLIEDRESRTLRALQESLGITPEEHARVLAEVRASVVA